MDLVPPPKHKAAAVFYYSKTRFASPNSNCDSPIDRFIHKHSTIPKFIVHPREGVGIFSQIVHPPPVLRDSHFRARAWTEVRNCAEACSSESRFTGCSNFRSARRRGDPHLEYVPFNARQRSMKTRFFENAWTTKWKRLPLLVLKF